MHCLNELFYITTERKRLTCVHEFDFDFDLDYSFQTVELQYFLVLTVPLFALVTTIFRLGLLLSPRGGGLLTRLRIGVCSPASHTLTLPRQKFPTLPRKKQVKLQPLPEFWYQTRIKTHP